MGDKMKWRKKIDAYDFAILEMGLYLDTHPDDEEAMKTRAAYMQKRCELIEEYEKCFGPYIVTQNDVTGDRWTWVDNLWPWDYMKGE